MVGSDIQVLKIAMALSEPKDKCITQFCPVKKKKVLPCRRQHVQKHRNVTLSHSTLP